ncbi:MAG: biopolymer transporter ExbD [Pontiellaceae bacterium]|nr:biopolymer transporter ExbD [Pontiellaceae bacterium]
MKPFDPHKQSKALRQFKPTRQRAGVFTIATAFCDAALLMLAFFLAVSPFVLQPGIQVDLPISTFSGGARFSSMVLSITRGGWFYFNDERLDSGRLPDALMEEAARNPGIPLIIEADRDVDLGRIVEAWNAAMGAGVQEVSIATRIAGVEETSP